MLVLKYFLGKTIWRGDLMQWIFWLFSSDIVLHDHVTSFGILWGFFIYFVMSSHVDFSWLQITVCCYDMVFLSKSQSNINVACSRKLTMSKSILSKQQILSLSSLYMGKETISLIRRFFKKHSVFVWMTPIQVEDATLAVRENVYFSIPCGFFEIPSG